MRKRVPVTVALRVDGHPTPYAAKTRLGRRPLQEMGRLTVEAKAASEQRRWHGKARRHFEQTLRDADCRTA